MKLIIRDVDKFKQKFINMSNNNFPRGIELVEDKDVIRIISRSSFRTALGIMRKDTIELCKNLD